MFIEVTKEQFFKCKRYLDNELYEDDIYMMFKTYLNEYISIFGYESWQQDPIKTICLNFCGSVRY